MKTNSAKNSRVEGVASKGFTLVELLVVIGILGVLMSLLIPSIGVARRKQQRSMAKNMLTEIGAALESFKAEWSYYPPTDLERELEYGGNGINNGIESMLGFLCSNSRGGPYYDITEDYIENTDKDSLPTADLIEEMNWIFGDGQLREIIDIWGNPLVYLENGSYDRTYAVVEVGELDAEGGMRTSSVTGLRSEKLSTYHSPTGYQLWSFGPNGINDNGGGDDICSW